MRINEYLRLFRGDKHNHPVPCVVCKDGLRMSVQGHAGAYCTPRIDHCHSYTSLEVGYPTKRVDELMEYAENPDYPTQTVYGYVPTTTVELVVDKHGGIDMGKVANTLFVWLNRARSDVSYIHDSYLGLMQDKCLSIPRELCHKCPAHYKNNREVNVCKVLSFGMLNNYNPGKTKLTWQERINVYAYRHGIDDVCNAYYRVYQEQST